MLTGPLHRVIDALFLRLAGGNTIRADEIKARTTASFLTLIMVSYLPLIAVVVILVINRPQLDNSATTQDQITAISAYATRYVDTYLKDPSNTAAIAQFYDGDMPTSALPAGGRALRASSALPAQFVDGIQTYSVVVDAEIPKAVNSASMVPVRLQVDIAADRHNLFRAFTLPHARPERPAGTAVELATQTLVSEDRPVYRTVNGFLSAMLIGQGDITPYIAPGSGLTAENPPRFTTLAIERIQTDSDLAAAQDVPPKADAIEVTARVIMQTSSGVLMPMDFPLVMSVAAGRWQVDRINDSPSIIAPTDLGSTTPSTAPMTTPNEPTTYPSYPHHTAEGN